MTGSCCSLSFMLQISYKQKQEKPEKGRSANGFSSCSFILHPDVTGQPRFIVEREIRPVGWRFISCIAQPEAIRWGQARACAQHSVLGTQSRQLGAQRCGVLGGIGCFGHACLRCLSERKKKRKRRKRRKQRRRRRRKKERKKEGRRRARRRRGGGGGWGAKA